MRTLIAAAALGLLAGASPALAQTADFAIPAHVSRVDGSPFIERAIDNATSGRESLERNLTLTEGDRIRTVSGRVEILFADGTLLHLDRHTIVDFLREDFVRVMEGRARWMVARRTDRAETARGDVLRVDTPAATLELDAGGDYRVGVAPNGDAELIVLRGGGAILNDQGETELRAGERAVAAAGRAPSQAYYANAAQQDDFDRWSDAGRRAHAAAESLRYLPNDLHPYGSVFDTYGSWRTDPTHGYVWYPVADAGWQPYVRGRWHSYPRYGWTWIGHDPWAWPTHHFGRWGFSAGAWFWIPGRSWSPAWVAWASSPGYVGWSPLGWDNRPLFAININIGNRYNNRYSAGYPWCGWTFLRERHFGGRSWGVSDIYVGSSVAVIARGGNITPVTDGPMAGRARPRNGVPAGTAVPRGTAIPRAGSGSGLTGSGGAREGGLSDVPAARPRRIPSETIRSRGTTAAPREGTAAPREGAATPRTSEPRSRAPREGSAAPAGSAARPRGGDPARSGDATQPSQSSPTTAPGRAIRRPSGETAPASSGGRAPLGSIYESPAAAVDRDAPYRRAPQMRERGGSAPAAERPSFGAAGSRRAAPREADRPAVSSPRTGERPAVSAPSAPPERSAQPRTRGISPTHRDPAAGRGERPASTPSARPAPAASGGGGERSGDRRAPSGNGSSTRGQARPRGGG